MSAMRGLTMFISDIRNCTSKEAETRRVEKELAHIRSSFSNKGGTDGYGTKKYVWKLLYMYMLGYDIEIGHMEALKLITSPKYSEKNAGYMSCSILWNENTEFLRLIIQSVKKDLANTSNDVYQCLALSLVANIGGQEFAESLALDVQKLLVSGKSRSFVRKKAALCLLRLFRRSAECVPQEDFPPKLIALLDDPNLGVVTSVSALLLGIVSHSITGYEDAPAKAIHLLAKLAFSKERKSVYRYYLTLCPWLQVKLLRILQYFPPPNDKNVMSRLNHVLNEILTKTAVTKNVNKNNADHSILFEAIHVIIHLCISGVKELQGQAIALLGRFI
jgi:AP-2 complex subunit alpha